MGELGRRTRCRRPITIPCRFRQATTDAGERAEPIRARLDSDVFDFPAGYGDDLALHAVMCGDRFFEFSSGGEGDAMTPARVLRVAASG
jgi:hypothetical protein